MLLRTGGVAPGATEGLEPTAARILRRARQRPWKGHGTAPAVDGAALSLKYGGDAAYRPRWQKATFKVPLGVSVETFQKEQVRLVHKWLNRMERIGWHWRREHGVQVYPGHYPAYDVDEGGLVQMDLGSREFVAQAVFQQQNPVHQRTEIDPALLVPVDVRWAASPKKGV